MQLDDMICFWLEHVLKLTGETEEQTISNGIYHQVAILEGEALTMFAYREHQ